MNWFSYAGNMPTKSIDPQGLAYFAKRPLHGGSWWGPLSGPGGGPGGTVLDNLNCEISHEQLFFEDGKQPSNRGLFLSGSVDIDPHYPGNADLYHRVPGHYDDCIARMAADAVPGGYYNFLGIDVVEIGPRTAPGPKFNCQDWASEVRRVYEILEDIPEIREQCDCPDQARENVNRRWWDMSGINLRHR